MKLLKAHWSKLAFHEAETHIGEIQSRLLVEVREIVGQTRDWFLHVVEISPDVEEVLLCRGYEEEDSWIVSVQLAVIRELVAGPGEAPLPEINGMRPSMPMAIEDPDNEVFVQIGEP